MAKKINKKQQKQKKGGGVRGEDDHDGRWAPVSSRRPMARNSTPGGKPILRANSNRGLAYQNFSQTNSGKTLLRSGSNSSTTRSLFGRGGEGGGGGTANRQRAGRGISL